MIRDHKDLKVWQVAVDLAEMVHTALQAFPAEERYGLTGQMLRAAVSIPSNIAEGYGRGTRLDYLRHLRIARGPACELETQVILAQRFGYLKDATDLMAVMSQCRRLLQALIKSLS
jgi:four helix bundle protein